MSQPWWWDDPDRTEADRALQDIRETLEAASKSREKPKEEEHE